MGSLTPCVNLFPNLHVAVVSTACSPSMYNDPALNKQAKKNNNISVIQAENLLKVSATLQDRPRADRCSVSCFYKKPYKPYIF